VLSTTDPLLPLIPWPAQLERGSGTCRLARNVVIAVAPYAPEGAATAAWLAEALRQRGLHPTVNLLGADSATPAGAITLVPADPGTPAAADSAYVLTVTPSGVTLGAGSAAGLFHGCQTFLQLLPQELATQPVIEIPALHIHDWPRFPWRGMHLDCARHFMPMPFLKRFIDQLARLKYNVFHWHLTEDQGWRIEIKKYPRLTEIGAWRAETVLGFEKGPGDGIPHGGFYTQDEVREIVAYAAVRQITVVPEIEMPGHSLAALAAYPEFSCTGGPFKVATEWGVFEDVYCLGNDQTLTFLEEVMEEVLALFPSPFIHIGGDECPKKRWHECPRCQARMREEGLKDEDELQSWLIRRMDTFLRARGRRLIGWDEILEGGLASGAAVMSWRGETGGIAAAQAGHDVVMTPGDSVYFNFSQDQPETNPLLVLAQIPHTPLAQVHQYEPVPDALSPAEAKHILGAQGQLWTEFMPTPQRVEHMAFPRAHALAEVLWSPRTARDYESFLTRLPATFQLLNNAGIAHGPIPCELAVI
jgi:hexosaminidase